jgi:hypothetical protein
MKRFDDSNEFQNELFGHLNLENQKIANSYNIDPLKNNIRQATLSLPEALTLLNAFEITIR